MSPADWIEWSEHLDQNQERIERQFESETNAAQSFQRFKSLNNFAAVLELASDYMGDFVLARSAGRY
jgi:hypothetical protein